MEQQASFPDYYTTMHGISIALFRSKSPAYVCGGGELRRLSRTFGKSKTKTFVPNHHGAQLRHVRTLLRLPARWNGERINQRVIDVEQVLEWHIQLMLVSGVSVAALAL